MLSRTGCVTPAAKPGRGLAPRGANVRTAVILSEAKDLSPGRARACPQRSEGMTDGRRGDTMDVHARTCTRIFFGLRSRLWGLPPPRYVSKRQKLTGCR